MKVRIYQIDHEKDAQKVAFLDYATTIERCGKVNESIYHQVYGGEVDCENLESLYALCNSDERPKGYYGESMSPSNIVAIEKNGYEFCCFCDSVGFKETNFDTAKVDTSDMMKVLIMENEKLPYVAEIRNDFRAMQSVVGGLIEPIYFDETNQALLFCNEEFLLNGSMPNRVIPELGICIHGTFFVCGNTFDEEGEEVSCSLTDEQIAAFTEKFSDFMVIVRVGDPDEDEDESETEEVSMT